MRITLFKRRRKNGFPSTTSVMPSSRISHDTVIGSYCYVGERCDITKSRIGNYVSIANNVSIGPGEHSIRDISTNALFYKAARAELTQGDCIIGSDAWIGVDAIVRRGVTIGIGAVVGANSFVNSDVPDFGVVVGSPAKLVDFRFPEAQQTALLESRWWEKDLEEAKVIVDALRRQFREI